VILFVFVREASSSRVLRSGRFERAAPATERVGAAP
jgi:hypothetical protein